MSIQNRNFAEANLPSSLDYAKIGDDYLNMIYNRPSDWRWRLPELDDIKLENDMINRGNFECSMDSFAAFAGASIPGVNMDGFAAFADAESEAGQPAMDDIDYNANLQPQPLDYNANLQPMPDYGQPSSHQEAPNRPAVSVAPGNNGNTATNILSGFLRDLTPVATTYVQGRVNPKAKAPAKPVINPSAGGRVVAAPAKSNTPMILAGVGLVALVLIVGK